MSETPGTTDPRPVYTRAAEQMATVFAAVGAEQLGLPTPCTEYDVRALMGHVIAGAHRVANAGEGTSSDGPDVPAWTQELPVETLPGAYDEARRRLSAVWADDAQLDALVTVPWGHVPGHVAMAGSVLETVTHTWDLTHAINWEGELDPELAEFALAVARQAVPAEGRGPSPFGEARRAPEGVDAYGRLAAWMGREPGGKGDA